MKPFETSSTLLFVVPAIRKLFCNGRYNIFLKRMPDLSKSPIPTSATPLVTSPLFPLLYWSLYVTQKHSPRITKTIFSEYDYIIVGAGSAGSTLAGRLSEMPCAKILLLEAGEIPSILTEIPSVNFRGSDIDWYYLTAPQRHAALLFNERKFRYSLGKVVGGSSVINDMLYVRGSRHVYDEWHRLGATDWSYSDVLPYFKKMEKNENPESIDIPFHGFDGLINVESIRSKLNYKSAMKSAVREIGYDLVDPNGLNQIGLYDAQYTKRRGRRCSTAKAYLVPAKNRKNLHIVSKAFVTKIIFNNKKAVAIEFTSDGKVYVIKVSQEVILSAGTLQTPKILMLSGVGPKERLQKLKIPVIADLPVGLNFHDHPKTFHLYTMDNALPERQVPPAFNILEYIKMGTGPLNAEGLLYILFASTEKHAAIDSVPGLEFYLLINSGIYLPDNFNQEVYNKVYGPYDNKTVFGCFPVLVRPKSRGFVSINSSKVHDIPIIDPNLLSHPDDIETLVEGLKICDELADTSSLKYFRIKPIQTKLTGCENYTRFSDEYLRCEVRSTATHDFHAAGTVKMGDIHDLSTVVDPYLRVKSLKGLRVVDASVMPIIPSGNINAPTIMIAEKAADIIKNDMRCGELQQHYFDMKPYQIDLSQNNI